MSFRADDSFRAVFKSFLVLLIRWNNSQ